jgi:hypothetical protein
LKISTEKMAVTQSRTQVNDRASGAEPMQKMNPSAVVPGQSITDIGGPNNTDYRPEGDSAKISNEGTSQVSDQVTNKGGKADPQKKYATPQDTLEGGASSGSYNGTTNGGGSGKEPMPKLSKQASYEHVEVDSKANSTLEELADAGGASDDFKSKAKVIFESALNQKLQIEVSRLEEEFSTRFEQEITDIAEKVEAFLNYTSQQWLEENKLVVENGIKNELSESFISGLKSLFDDHYVTLPDEKYDIFESMVSKLDDMEEKLNEQIEVNVGLNSQMSGFSRSSTLSDVSWDLSEAGKEKLAELAESVEFESEDSFRNKLNILKESFVSEEVAPAASGEYLNEEVEAPVAMTAEEGMTGSMARYARALSMTVKN